MSSMDSCRLHFENARHVLNASRGRNSCECMHDCWLYNTAVRPLTYPPSCVTSCRPVSHGMRLQVKLINDMGNRVAVHDIGIGAAGAACFLLGIPETPGQRVGGDARQRTEAQVSCLCLSNNQTVQIFSVGDPLRKPHSLCKHAHTCNCICHTHLHSQNWPTQQAFLQFLQYGPHRTHPCLPLFMLSSDSVLN